MKLLTHNMLKSHVKGVKEGYPMLLTVRPRVSCPRSAHVCTHVATLRTWQATKVEEKPVDFNAEFIVRMLDRINWKVLVETARQVGTVEAVCCVCDGV
jgi:multifunctional methyltransferase subunit TRM112